MLKCYTSALHFRVHFGPSWSSQVNHSRRIMKTRAKSLSTLAQFALLPDLAENTSKVFQRWFSIRAVFYRNQKKIFVSKARKAIL